MPAAADVAGGARLVELGEVASTNDEARRRAAEGEPTPLWVRADRQTQGRGRRGRAWVGLKGNLFLSGAYHLACPAAEAAQLSFAAALAAGDFFDDCVEASRVTFKWPNDVLIDGGKAAGVLLEAESAARGLMLVVGVGVNLANAPKDAAVHAISLAAATGRRAPKLARAARRIIEAFEAWRTRWAEDGFAPLREAWLARAAGLGGRVSAQLADEAVEGVFEDLDADGALVVTTRAGQRLVRSGEVFFGNAEGAV